jgi:uroporphyrinogen-III synthase
MSLPLAGLRIAVTRPAAQAEGLMARIAELGGAPLRFPLLEVAPPEDGVPLQSQLQGISRFDLLVFISPNAVRFGLQAIQEAGGLPARVRVAAVGQGSARALAEAGVEPVIAPTERFDSEALLALPELQRVAGWRVGILRGDGGRETLAEVLHQRGAAVEYLECYRRIKPPLAVEELLAQRPDALLVTSSEALQHLWELTEASLRDSLVDIPLFTLHPRIAAVAQQLGWREAVCAGSGDDGLLAGLVGWAKTRKIR